MGLALKSDSQIPAKISGTVTYYAQGYIIYNIILTGQFFNEKLRISHARRTTDLSLLQAIYSEWAMEGNRAVIYYN